MRRGFLSVLVISLLILLFAATSAHALRKVSLQPALFEFSSAPGSEISNTFLIENEGTEDLSHVFVYSTNVKVDKNGKERYELPRPEHQILSSPASWVYIKVPDPTKIIGNFPFLELKKGESKNVDFVIKIPKDAPPGDYTTVVFFEARSPLTAKTIGTNIGARIGCRIRIRVQGEIIEDVIFDYLKLRRLVVGETIPFDFNLLNKGNIDAAGSVVASIKRPDGSVVYEKYLSKKSYLYARNHLTFQGALKVKNLGFGYKTFEAKFTYKDWKGNTKELRKTVGFIAVPLTVFYALLFLIALLILLLSYWIDSKLKKRGEAFRQVG